MWGELVPQVGGGWGARASPLRQQSGQEGVSARLWLLNCPAVGIGAACYNPPPRCEMLTSISIKGVRDGLLITLPEGNWPDVEASLLETIDQQGTFFRGARVALQLGGRELGAAELGGLRDHLSEREVVLWAVLSESEATRTAAADFGLATTLGSGTAADHRPPAADLAADSAILVARTLRSGYRLHHPGHVVVIGDVNPGAEIVAGGNVVVWGRLRGVVHAGAAGDSTAVVCALDLSPTQLRIADHIAVSPERRGKARPEIAFVRDGQLVAESWDRDRGR